MPGDAGDPGGSSSGTADAPGPTAEYETLANTVADGLFQVDDDYHFVVVNDAFCDLTNRSRDELLDQPLSGAFTERNAARLRDACRGLSDSNPDTTTVSASIVTAAGEDQPCEIRLRFLDDSGVAGSVRTTDGWTADDRKYEQFGSTLLADLPGVVYRCVDEPGWPMTFVSEGCEELTGYQAEALMDGDVSWYEDIVHRDDRDDLQNDVLSALDENGRFEVGYRIQTVNGETRWVWGRGRGVFDDGELVAMEGFVSDITDYRKVRDRLDEETKKFESLVDAVENYAIFMLDPDGHVTSWNAGAQRIKGYEADEIIGEHFSRFYTHDDVRAGVPQANLDAAKTGANEDEGWRVRADGTLFWANVTITPVRDDGSLVGYAKVTRDMTEHRDYQEQLRHERDLVSQILETSPAGIALIDQDNTILRANDRAAEIVGRSTAELHGMASTNIELFDEEGRPTPPEDHPSIQALESNEAVVGGEYLIEQPDGERRWLTINASSIQNDEGAKVVISAQDVTPLKRREVELRRERDLIDRILGANPVGIAVLDGSGEISRLNGAGAEILGVDSDEIGDYDLDDWLIYDENGDRVPPSGWPQSRVLRTREPIFDWRCRIGTMDETHRWVSANAVPLLDETGAVDRVILTANDITPLKRREAELRRERDLVEKVIEVSPDTIGVFDADDSTLLRANARAEEFLNVSTTSSDRYEYVGGEVPLYGEDGEPVPPEERPFARAIRTGEAVYDWQGQMENADGQLRWFSINATPLYEDGRVERVVVIGDDITKLKEQARALARERDELETELGEVFERVDDAFFALDDEWRFTHVNEQAEQLIDCKEAEVLGEVIWNEYPESVDTAFQREEERAMETQQPVSFEEYYPPLETWFEVNVYPSETGLSVYFRDVTERKERERELERYETIIETARDGIYAVDEDGRFTLVNDAYAEMTGYDREQLLGADVTLVVDESTASNAQSIQRELIDGEREGATVEADVHTADGDSVPTEATFAMLSGNDETYERIAVVRDVSDRKERERALEESERRYRTLAEHFPNGAVGVYDHDLRYTLAEGAVLGDTLPSADRMEGNRVSEIFPAETIADLEPLFRAAVEEDETDSATVGFGGRTWRVWATPLRDADGETFAGLSITQDITERVERERDLELYETIVETIWDGVYALDPDDNFALVNETFASLTGYDREELLGQPASMVHDEHISATAQQLTGEIMAGEREVATLETSMVTSTGESVPVETRFGPYPYDEERHGRTGVSRDITDRLERERALARQREQLAALNRLNQVVQKITHAVVDSSSRAEIERLVCERLADSESYLFAWVGEVDRTSNTVALRTEAGVDGYLDGVTMPIGSGGIGDGPTSRAIRTQEPQIVQNVLANTDYKPWRDHARSHGFRSSAAIPISYEDALYGVLNVYSEREDAFGGHERTLLTQLGNVVGHAINAVERMEALMSDRVVEVEFVLPNILDRMNIVSEIDATIAFDRAVPVDDGSYLEYGTMTTEGVDLLDALVESLPHIKSYEIIGEEFGTVRFELRLDEPPAVSTIASYGGRVRSAIIEGGDFQMNVELPPSADVRSVVEAIQKTYPRLELLAQRRTARETLTADRVDTILAEELTDRQRTILQAAYFAGYFDTPRKRSGEKVAESIGITPPTLHQHLRKGQRKLLAAVFE